MADNKKKKSCFKDPIHCLFDKVKGVYKSIHKYLTGHDIQSLHMFYILLALTIAPLIIFNFEGAKRVFIVLIVLSPVWLTLALIFTIWGIWMDYINLKFLADSKQESQLYEIVVPKTITKSPAAMELFFEGLLLTQGTSTEIDKYWRGRLRPWWSLEITGINGEVRMYFWCWKRFKEHVEAQLYAQYPEVELIEVDDYSKKIEYDPDKHFALGHRFKLAKEEALPIKTYYDYGLHEHADKWETKIDPMVNVLEKFALMQQGEQMWLQILFQKSDRKVAEEAEKTIEKIYKDKTPEYPAMDGSDEKVKGFPMLLPSEREKVEAIQRASKKPSFDCIIRGLYIAEKEHMNTLRVQSMGKMFNYYNGFNELKPFDGGASGGDYPWEKLTLPNLHGILKDFIEAYRLRSGFNVPFKKPTITLTTEELATLFHFPSEEGRVPGLQKSQSKSSVPPPNLPTE